jgi:hypothetical protein
MCWAVKGAAVKTAAKTIGASYARQPVFEAPSPLGRAVYPFILIFMAVGAANAQIDSQDVSRNLPKETTASVPVSLPEAPVSASLAEMKADYAPAATQAATSGVEVPDRTVHTGNFDNLIDPEEIAPRLSAGDKVGMGLKASVSPFAVIGWIGSATYSEAFNRSPNYGQSAKDYAQRLGAAAARASSQGIFSTAVMAPILHEDPRYFAEGPGRPGLHRAFYALSRVLVAKTDDGRSTINYALLSGNAIGAGLTQTYYPAGNRNFHGTVTTFGVSLAGSGVKFLFEEFFYKEASIAQLKRRF